MALAALAAVVALMAFRPRARGPIALAFLVACGVTWYELGTSAAVVECASAAAGSLAVRRRGLMGKARADAELAGALPDALDLLAA